LWRYFVKKLFKNATELRSTEKRRLCVTCVDAAVAGAHRLLG